MSDLGSINSNNNNGNKNGNLQPFVLGNKKPKPLPPCEFGADCYRTNNATHMAEYSHPKNINVEGRIRGVVVGTSSAEKYAWTAGDQVFLVVDRREVLEKNVKEPMSRLLDATGVPWQERDLKLGDMTWVVVKRSGKEYMIRHIVERKDVRDLSTSIKDGRYRSQKSRLRQANLSSVVYLVEGKLFNNHGNRSQKDKERMLPKESLEQAIYTTTYGDSNFVTTRTEDKKHSASFLAFYTENLQLMIESSGDDLTDLVFDFDLDSFNEANAKTLDVSLLDVFCKQLLNLTKISDAKALAIIKEYPTVCHLMEAYESLGDDVKAKRLMLANLDAGGKRVGPAASEVVYKTYCE